MITLEKTRKHAAWLKFDKAGAAQLIHALSNIYENAETEREVTALIDSGLLGSRKRETIPRTLRLTTQDTDQSDGSITREGIVVVWKLVEAEDEISYALQRLKDALEQGQFFPAEFLMVKAPKSRDLIQIFGEFIP